MLVHGIVHFDYVPLRSEEPLSHFRNNLSRNVTFLYVLCNPSRKFKRRCAQSIRSCTFCATLPANSKKDVLKSYVPIRSEQPSRISRLICYVPIRSITFLHVLPMNLTKPYVFLTFPHVPCNSIVKTTRSKTKWPKKWTASHKNAGEVSGTHPAGLQSSCLQGPQPVS